MTWKKIACVLTIAAGNFMAAVIAVATPTKASADVAAAAPPSTQPTLYVVGYSHLDTEWRWSYPQVIRQFIRNTLHDNFALFEKYPDYLFNWTGANRYRLMKEYYPQDYLRLKNYVAAGRWYPNGSSLEEGDVDIPSSESIVRQVLYGNEFYRREFNISPSDFMLPDCFGFPASLPTILAHCGLKGFSTQKLTWGSAVGIPFNVGVWQGPDGRGVVAALNPGAYNSSIDSNLSRDPGWIARLNADGQDSGVYVDYRYYGNGDQGGSAHEGSVKNLEESVKDNGPVHVVSARADQIFDDLTADQIARLPKYKGDLLLTWHSAGSATSQAQMKHWNRENELLGDETERASVAADWLGSLAYQRDRITDAWWRFLPGQFHDLMAGTALPMAYHFAWNDQALAINEFSGVLGEAAGALIRGLDTRASGVPIVVYNPVSLDRQDIAQATVNFPGPAPEAVAVFDSTGKQVPSQVLSSHGNSLTILLLARVPSVGFAVFDVRPVAPASAEPAVSASPSGLENQRYRLTINSAGDVASIYDKLNRREMLAAPARLAFIHERPALYPAWNMDWEDQQKPPYAYVDGPAKITVVESGPVRASVKIERQAQGSTFEQTISLAAGSAGDQIVFHNHFQWQTSGCALKAVFPMAASNPLATYNWEPGAISRGNNDPKKYEVPLHQWMDLTNSDNAFGISVLCRDKYGSDKPDNSTLRLTLLYTPGVRDSFQDQATQDWGEHDFVYTLYPHAADWSAAATPAQAALLNQPLVSFQPPQHEGVLGKSWSFLHVSDPAVKVEAIKKAEDNDQVIVRLCEVAGKTAQDTELSFASPVTSATEVDGQERPLKAAEIRDGKLIATLNPFELGAFAVTLAPPPARLDVPLSTALDLPLNCNVVSQAPGATGADFDGKGNAIAGDMLPGQIDCDGVSFKIPPHSAAANNAVACDGQSLAIPADQSGSPGAHRRIYLLAASSDGDIPADFEVGSQSFRQIVQAWNGVIGEWDTRLWRGEVPELAFEWKTPFAGLEPGFIKPDAVAWYADHTRRKDGSDDPYAFTYLFRYAFDLPTGATMLVLPHDRRIKVLAASIATDINQDSAPAGSLYDLPDHRASQSVVLDPNGGTFDHIVKVKISPPLYHDGGIHYTTDGSDLTTASPVFHNRVNLGSNTTLKAASFSATGECGPISKAKFEISNSTPPAVNSVRLDGMDLKVEFNEPLNRHSAENLSHYSLTPPVDLTQARLSDSADVVSLTLSKPLDESAQYKLWVSGVRDLSGNRLAGKVSRDLGPLGPIVNVEGVHAFDANSAGLDVGQELLHNPASPAPAAFPSDGAASWTMNVFVRPDAKVQEKTTIAGFGSDADQGQTQRYIVFLRKGLSFWGSNVDVRTDARFDVGKWQMVTMSFDGQYLRIYKNAERLAKEEIALVDAAPIVRLAPPGAWPDSKKFVGKLADFQLWARALDPQSIQKLMAKMPAD
jgi:alpha-mannosidase